MSKTRDHESYSFLKSALTPENPKIMDEERSIFRILLLILRLER